MQSRIKKINDMPLELKQITTSILQLTNFNMIRVIKFTLYSS